MALNFPADPKEGDTHFEASNGVTYTFKNGGWVASAGTQDDLDKRYVKSAGDNMTGNLSLGTNKITLNVDGSITAAGDVTTGEFINVRNTDSSLGAIYIGNADGNPARSNIAFEISPTVSSNNATVRLNYNGTATFNGLVETKSYFYNQNANTAVAGMYLLNNSGIARTDNALYISKDNTTTNQAIALDYDGTGTFAGNVSVAGQLNTQNGNKFVALSAVPFDSGTKIYGHFDGTSYTSSFTPSGEANFAGIATAKGLTLKPTSDSGGIYIQDKDDASKFPVVITEDGSGTFRGSLSVAGEGTGQYCELLPSGSATFTGTVSAAGQITSSDAVMCRIGEERSYLLPGLVEITSTTKDSTTAFRLTGGRGSGAVEDVVTMTTAGSARFAGDTHVGDPASTYVYSESTGNFVIKSPSGSTDQCFGITRVGDATYSTEITADGSAKFAGDVLVGTNLTIRSDGALYTTTGGYSLAADGGAAFNGLTRAGALVTGSLLSFTAGQPAEGTYPVEFTGNGFATFNGTVTANGAILTRAGGDLDVGDRLEKLDTALTGLKAALVSTTDHASLKTALIAALANI